jgi:hypothetical protein
MAYQPEWPPYQPEGRRPRGLICHAIWILTCIILFITYYQAKISVINEDKILKYLTIDFFVVTYFFIVTSLICILCTHTDNDMHFLHRVLIWVIVTSPIQGWAVKTVQILHNHYQVYDKKP